jgi:hypothetical protein
LTAIAELPQQRHRREIFDGGYPSFPLKEIAVCRTVYGESTKKDLDIAHFRAGSQAPSSAAQGASHRLWRVQSFFESINNINDLSQGDEAGHARSL